MDFTLAHNFFISIFCVVLKFVQFVKKISPFVCYTVYVLPIIIVYGKLHSINGKKKTKKQL